MEKDDRKIEMKYMGMSEVLGTSDVSLIILVAPSHNVQLVVTCDKDIKRQLLLRSMPDHEKKTIRFLPEVLYQMAGMNLELDICDIYDGEYEARLRNVDTDEAWEIRCGDGLLLAVANHLPIYASADLLRHQGAPYNPLSGKVAIPINVLSGELLQKALDDAIEREDYERASVLRDAMRQRKDKNPTETAEEE